MSAPKTPPYDPRPYFYDPEMDSPSHPGYWWWWLKTRWLPHRNAVADVHPLLARLDAAKGHAFITTANVVKVLDARDPEALVASWGLEALARQQP